MGIYEVAKYLVVKALAARFDVIDAIYSYFVEGASPSSIASELGMSKHQVRGYVQRIVEKAGSVARARVLVKYVVPHVRRIKPIAMIDGVFAWCRICDVRIWREAFDDHVRIYHGRIVEDLVENVLEALRCEVLRVRR